MIFISGTWECSRPRYRRRIGPGVDTVRVATASGVARPGGVRVRHRGLAQAAPVPSVRLTPHAALAHPTTPTRRQIRAQGGDGVKIGQRVDVGGPDRQLMFRAPVGGARYPRCTGPRSGFSTRQHGETIEVEHDGDGHAIVGAKILRRHQLTHRHPVEAGELRQLLHGHRPITALVGTHYHSLPPATGALLHPLQGQPLTLADITQSRTKNCT